MPSWPESKGPGGFLPFFSGVFSLGAPERQLRFPPSRRGPASMPPRCAAATMHNHAAAESLSGTWGCNIDAPSTCLALLSGINKAKSPFVLLSTRSLWSLESKHCSSLQASTLNFTKFIFLPSCACRADSAAIINLITFPQYCDKLQPVCSGVSAQGTSERFEASRENSRGVSRSWHFHGIE